MKTETELREEIRKLEKQYIDGINCGTKRLCKVQRNALLWVLGEEE